MKNILTEESLADIILCEPVTKKGKRALERLGLSDEKVTVDFFYKNLCVLSKYEGQYVTEEIDEDEEDENEETKKQEFLGIKDEYEDFTRRMTSDMKDQSPLFIIGVAGNGKSIEVNKALHSHFRHNVNINQVCIDFEDSPIADLTYVDEYDIPLENNVLFVFGCKIVETIMQYLISNEDKCTQIRGTFYQDIESYKVTDEQIEIFNDVGDFKKSDRNSIKKVYGHLTGYLNKNTKTELINGIRSLIKIFLWLMYCSDRDKMNYIIIDNIESYIYLNENCIQILDDDIKDICLSIRSVTDQVIRDFNTGMGGDQASDTLGWKRFKVVIVARRTSLGALSKMVLHRPLIRRKNIMDITGHFMLSDIWIKKRLFIWNMMLEKEFKENDPFCKSKIDIANFVIVISKKAKGKSYQSLIAPLMSYGIRRNGYAQAHAIFHMHEQLFRGDAYSINYAQFEELRKNNLTNAARYMVRRALIESQFRWSITDIASRKRWEGLGIGNLKYDERGRPYTFSPRKSSINIAKVIYKDNNNITLMHRVLSYLSNYPDYATRVSKPVDLMFATVPLYDLIKDVIVGPRDTRVPTKNELKSLARVLISLCNMSNYETKGAPFAILGIKDQIYHNNSSEDKLACIFEEIYNSEQNDREEEGKYNAIDYGVRLTDAGFSFLSRWMASFSFIESLYCYPLPSLFYLNNYNDIDYVISKVYSSALYLRSAYKREAQAFCDDTEKFYDGKYLFRKNDCLLTYSKHMHDEHTHFLNQYKTYVLENYYFLGINEEDSKKIKILVEDTIKKYDNWKEEERGSVCF